jgi:hypothetical protein
MRNDESKKQRNRLTAGDDYAQRGQFDSLLWGVAMAVVREIELRSALAQ